MNYELHGMIFPVDKSHEDFRHEALLKGVTLWLCEGRRDLVLNTAEVWQKNMGSYPLVN